jgi:hypothetical protein
MDRDAENEACAFLRERREAEVAAKALTVPTENARERLAAIAKHVIDFEVTYEESDWYLFADAVIAAGFPFPVPVGKAEAPDGEN